MKVLQKPVFIGVGIFLAGILLTGMISRYYISKTNEIAENVAESYMERFEVQQPEIKAEADTVTGISNTSEPETFTEQAEETKEDVFSPRQPVLGGVLNGYTGTNPVYFEVLGVYRAHPGVDLRAQAGEAVLACEKGVVQTIVQDSLYGKTVKVDHGNGYISCYANLSDSVNVQVGEAVFKGDLIGTVGETALLETQTEPHLHFEVFKDGQSVNPEEFLGY